MSPARGLVQLSWPESLPRYIADIFCNSTKSKGGCGCTLLPQLGREDRFLNTASKRRIRGDSHDTHSQNYCRTHFFCGVGRRSRSAIHDPNSRPATEGLHHSDPRRDADNRRSHAGWWLSSSNTRGNADVHQSHARWWLSSSNTRRIADLYQSQMSSAFRPTTATALAWVVQADCDAARCRSIALPRTRLRGTGKRKALHGSRSAPTTNYLGICRGGRCLVSALPATPTSVDFSKRAQPTPGICWRRCISAHPHQYSRKKCCIAWTPLWWAFSGTRKAKPQSPSSFPAATP
jgi:hypothetical protein